MFDRVTLDYREPQVLKGGPSAESQQTCLTSPNILQSSATCQVLPGSSFQYVLVFDVDAFSSSDIVKGVSNCNNEDRSGRPFVVSIEGNIGSGKSTMLKYFEKFEDVELVPEPVAEWCNVGGRFQI